MVLLYKVDALFPLISLFHFGLGKKKYNQKHTLVSHVPKHPSCRISGSCCIRGGRGVGGARKTITSLRRRCVVIVETSRLEQLHRNINVKDEVFSSDERTNDESKEDNEHNEEQDGISYNTTLPELGLLEGVDRRANLSAVIKC